MISYIAHFHETELPRIGTTYANLAAFQAGASKEANGLFGVPQFLSNYRLSSSSPAVNAGVVISNFNDAASAWPYTASAPDIGAFEIIGVLNAVNLNVGRISKQ